MFFFNDVSERLNEGETPQLPSTPSSDEEENEEDDNDASHNHKSEGTDMNASEYTLQIAHQLHVNMNYLSSFQCAH